MGVVTNTSIRAVSVAVLAMPLGGALGDRREAILDGGVLSVESVLLQNRAQVAEVHANVLAARGVAEVSLEARNAFCEQVGLRPRASISSQESPEACAAWIRRELHGFPQGIPGLWFHYSAERGVCLAIPQELEAQKVKDDDLFSLYSMRLDDESILAECRDDVRADADAECSPNLDEEGRMKCIIDECAKGLRTRDRCYDAAQAYLSSE